LSGGHFTVMDIGFRSEAQKSLIGMAVVRTKTA
jgi:hypothetical protein